MLAEENLQQGISFELKDLLWILIIAVVIAIIWLVYPRTCQCPTLLSFPAEYYPIDFYSQNKALYLNYSFNSSTDDLFVTVFTNAKPDKNIKAMQHNFYFPMCAKYRRSVNKTIYGGFALESSENSSDTRPYIEYIKSNIKSYKCSPLWRILN